METTKHKKMLHFFIGIVIIALIAIIIGLLMLKYDVEGETNLPFELSKIIVVSTAEGMPKQNEENKWDLNLTQDNDIFLYINKNEDNKKEEVIDTIRIENISLVEKPQIGTMQIYKPANEDGSKFKLQEEYKVENKIEYKGSTKTDAKNLQISNQGGMIAFRYANQNLGEFISNEAEEISHDGTLLAKNGITQEQLKCKLSFDLIISLKSEKSFKANIQLDLPTGNILETGTDNYEKNNVSDIVFKRLP